MEKDFRDKMKTSEFKDIKSEKMLLAGIIKYDEVVRKCMESFNSEIFCSNRCKWIFEQIMDFYDKNTVLMNEDSFIVYLERKEMKERGALLKLWKNIRSHKKEVKIPTCYAIMMKLTKLHLARLMQVGMQDTIGSLTRAIEGGEHHIDKAIGSYLAITSRLETKQVFTTITEPVSLYENFKKKHLSIQKNPEKYLGIPTGIRQLDESMGGLRPSELGLVTAGTGVGKSIILLDFAFNCFISVVGNVLYVTIEMPENQLRERFYCRLSGIKYNHFRQFTLNEKHWSILDKKMESISKLENKFHILDIPQSCSVKVLKNEIETHIKHHGPPKLIIIDYLNILQGGFDWTKQLENAVAVKQFIARYFKIATWTANQLTGSKHEKEHIKISDMGFAKNIADNVDVGIGLGLTDSSEEEGIFNVDFTKTRDFQGKGFVIQADRSRMTFTKPPPSEELMGNKMKKKNKIGGVLT